LTDEVKSRLSQEYQAAKKALDRRLAAETWLIPDDCRQRLIKMKRELHYEGNNWFELLETGQSVISATEDDLRKLVRSDLKLEQSLLHSLLRRLAA
jgi:hypothetical protein